jgi:large subunit ribosomal protein L15
MKKLNNLISIVSKSQKRVGRGYGSGVGGHTSTRGQKGQKSRSGSKIPLWFEGGQLPLIKRMPMLRGKGRMNVVRPTFEVSLTELNGMTATEVTLDTLKLENIVSARAKVAKVIATGTLSRVINLKGVRTSAQAKVAIEQAGGTVAE